MFRHRRPAATLALLLAALLPSTVLAAAPVALDDPSAACGNVGFGGAFPIPEDWSGGQSGYEDWYIFSGPCEVLANDTDADGDELSLELVGQPDHGDAMVVNQVLLAYRPDPDVNTPAGDLPNGEWFTDVVEYHAFDGSSLSNQAEMRLWIAPVNDPPTFTPGPATVTVAEDSGAYSAAWASEIAAGPANEADQTVTFEVTDLDVTGVPDLFAVAPAIDSDGTLTFTPGPDQVGLASVTVRATDDGGLEDYDLPSGDMDPPDDTSDETTFQIAVEPVNDAPVANDDPSEACGPTTQTGGSFLVPEYDPGPFHDAEIVLFGDCALLANDTDADGDALTYEIVVPPTHGTATPIDEQFLSYAPDEDYGTRPGDVPGGTWVSDSFTYRAFDGVAYSEPATMRFWIAEINDAPSFTPGDDVTVGEDSGPYLAAWASEISAGPESEAWQQVGFEVLAVDVVSDGTLFSSEPAVAEDGTLSFTSAANAEGSAVVTIQAHDDGGVDDYGIGTPTLYPDDTSDPVTFTITVTDENAPPVADDDALTVAEGASATSVPVLAGDVDSDGDPLSIIAKTDGAKGGVAITGGGTGLTYDPGPLQEGSDAFTYTIDDGRGGTDTATVNVTIVPDATGPLITAVTESLPLQTIGTNTVRVQLAWSGADPGSGVSAYEVQTSVDGGPWTGLALSKPTATSVERVLAFGKAYRFRVRGTDGSGNVGAYREWALLRPTLYQETSSIATYTGVWSTVRSPLASGGASRSTSAAGRKVTITFTGHDVGWVSMRRMSGGSAEVRVDGALVATVDLSRPRIPSGQLVFVRHLTTSSPHTLDIRPLGDGRVDIDAIVVLR